jgi:hypothetical protein
VKYKSKWAIYKIESPIKSDKEDSAYVVRPYNGIDKGYISIHENKHEAKSKAYELAAAL